MPPLPPLLVIVLCILSTQWFSQESRACVRICGSRTKRSNRLVTTLLVQFVQYCAVYSSLGQKPIKRWRQAGCENTSADHVCAHNRAIGWDPPESSHTASTRQRKRQQQQQRAEFEVRFVSFVSRTPTHPQNNKQTPCCGECWILRPRWWHNASCLLQTTTTFSPCN